MGYNFEKSDCDNCGVTQKELDKEPSKYGVCPDRQNYLTERTGGYDTSLHLSADGGVLCPKCHREKEIGRIFSSR